METKQKDSSIDEEHTWHQKVDSPGKIDLRGTWKCIRQFGAGSEQFLHIVFESAFSKSDVSIHCSYRSKPPDTPKHIDVIET